MVTENGRETQSHLIIRFLSFYPLPLIWELGQLSFVELSTNLNLIKNIGINIHSCLISDHPHQECPSLLLLLLLFIIIYNYYYYVARNARPSDSGNYTCKPSIFKTAAVRLHVLTGYTIFDCILYLYLLDMLILCDSALTNAIHTFLFCLGQI